MGGLIGTATKGKDGLMPKLAARNNEVYGVTSYSIYKLYTFGTWDVQGANIRYFGENKSGNITISSVNDEKKNQHSITMSGTISPIKLYEKDKSVYLYANQRGSTARALISSTQIIEQTYYGETTTALSGYTKISIS